MQLYIIRVLLVGLAWEAIGRNTVADTILVPDEYATIQAAIDAAESFNDEIIVSSGTYLEKIDFLGKTLILQSANGPETTTIDSSGLSGSVVSIGGRVGPDCVLDGFTITGGGHSSSFLRGGGLWCSLGDPTITNCIFEGNTADRGGGIYIRNGNPVIIACIVRGNSAEYGGGVAVVNGNPLIEGCTLFGNISDLRGGGMYNLNSQPRVTGCVFDSNMGLGLATGGAIHNENSSLEICQTSLVGNVTGSFGGAMYNTDFSFADIFNCDFDTNHSGSLGGALCNRENSLPAISDCTFTNNTADTDGGGVYTGSNGSYRIDGCRFESNLTNGGGGAVFNFGSNCTVDSCEFTENESISFAGAAICNLEGEATITASTFDRNVARGGAGIYSFNSPTFVAHCDFNDNDGWTGAAIYGTGDLIVSHSRFSGNIASSQSPRGGAIYNFGATNSQLSDCSFVNNATMGIAYGGALFLTGSNMLLERCLFIGNSSYGGGAFSSEDDSTPEFRDCQFIRNDGYFGGAIQLDDAEGIVQRCMFAGNSANEGGAISVSSCSPLISNCMMVGNTAEKGGAVHVRWKSSAPTIESCTVAGNHADLGGGIRTFSGSPVLDHCILSNNEPQSIAGITPVTTYSIVDGGPVEKTNIDEDPMFVSMPNPGTDGEWGTEDDDYGDLRLQFGSPAINSGDELFDDTDYPLDLSGHARVLHGQIDRGAYEWGIGDFDMSGVVELPDHGAMASCLNGPKEMTTNIDCRVFDFDGDQDVDIADVSQFTRNYAPQ